jgi:hypothetical protein
MKATPHPMVSAATQAAAAMPVPIQKFFHFSLTTHRPSPDATPTAPGCAGATTADHDDPDATSPARRLCSGDADG